MLASGCFRNHTMSIPLPCGSLRRTCWPLHRYARSQAYPSRLTHLGPRHHVLSRASSRCCCCPLGGPSLCAVGWECSFCYALVLAVVMVAHEYLGLFAEQGQAPQNTEITDVEEEFVVTEDGIGSWQPVTKQRASAPATKKQKAKQAPSASSGPAEIEEF